MEPTLRIGIVGKGAIGAFVGARLLAAHGSVIFLVREGPEADGPSSALDISDLAGKQFRIEATRVKTTSDPARLADCDAILICVKSGQTIEVAERIAPYARTAVIVSLQNGVRNPTVLRERLPESLVLGGIVAFNVISPVAHVYRRATSGPLVIERSSDPRARAVVDTLASTGLEIEVTDDLPAKQWSKLVMNLNNAVSALTDLPTREILFRAEPREVLALILRESLAVMRVAGIRPARLGRVPVSWFPLVLRLPTPLVKVVARAQLKIDKDARSSMWQDLDKGRKTEVDELNGEIVRLANTCGSRAPINQRIVELVHEAEERNNRSPRLAPEDLARDLRERARASTATTAAH